MEKNITPINQLSWKDRLKSYKNIRDLLFYCFWWEPLQ